jgi:hypothetical protein
MVEAGVGAIVAAGVGAIVDVPLDDAVADACSHEIRRTVSATARAAVLTVRIGRAALRRAHLTFRRPTRTSSTGCDLPAALSRLLAT